MKEKEFNPERIIKESRFFSAREFPDGALDHMDAAFAWQLDQYRRELGAPIMPSPIREAWYRTSGSKKSRHYAVGRYSDAGDVFPLRCDIRRAVMLATRRFGGVGFYLDTRPSVMLHLDLREEQVLWCRIDGEYIYADRDPDRYFRSLANAG